MPQTMKAAVVHEFGKPLTIEEVLVPQPGPGQILVKIAATGVCHTDMHAANGDWPVKHKPPRRSRRRCSKTSTRSLPACIAAISRAASCSIFKEDTESSLSNAQPLPLYGENRIVILG
jgi:Alcohol dehydrogenase GroES-like domain